VLADVGMGGRIVREAGGGRRPEAIREIPFCTASGLRRRGFRTGHISDRAGGQEENEAGAGGRTSAPREAQPWDEVKA
jgi:hypothetical protein